jgi:hypothetical protein
MSGPIIRKYGFPNFEKIFGERELKHGAEPTAPQTESASTPPEASKPDSTDKSAPGGSEAPANPAQ